MASRRQSEGEQTRFPPDLMYRAALGYYTHDHNQAEIAASLGVSRPTVSRLLAEARRHGIVEIIVHPPAMAPNAAINDELAHRLGLQRVYVTPSSGTNLGATMATGVGEALSDAGLNAGDVILISSGRTLFEVAQQPLPRIPGVILAPTVGGQEEPEPWWQTNAITRMFAEQMGGRPVYLYAPALPGPAMHRSLAKEPSFQRVHQLWSAARAALVGVGAPVLTRATMASFVPTDQLLLRETIGDICSRFYDRSGREVAFPGSERIVATSLEDLRRIPACIAVAAGLDKVPSIAAGAAGGFFNRLVTDIDTAQALLQG